MNAKFKIAAVFALLGLLSFPSFDFNGSIAAISIAQAQHISSGKSARSGSYLSRARRSGLGPSYSIKRSNHFRSTNRTGVYRSLKPSRYIKFRHGQQIRNSGDRLFIERRRQIERRNARVVRENNIRRLNSQSHNQPIFVDPYYNDNGSGFREVIGGNGSGVMIYRGQPCPSGHNCGYRLYKNGTGPRIITLGVPSGNGLPEYDGLNGPQVITLDD